jgi:hypothetical protein
VQQDQVSLGVIDGDEIIVRGALDPRHLNKSRTKVRAAIIQSDHLLAGQLSVWRMGPVGIKCDELVARLSDVPGQSLFALYGVPASAIRSISVEGGVRALSVVDECECDAEGNKHEAHAHIAICKGLIEQGMTKVDKEFEQIKTDLYGMLKQRPVWERAAVD